MVEPMPPPPPPEPAPVSYYPPVQIQPSVPQAVPVVAPGAPTTITITPEAAAGVDQTQLYGLIQGLLGAQQNAANPPPAAPADTTTVVNVPGPVVMPVEAPAPAPAPAPSLAPVRQSGALLSLIGTCLFGCCRLMFATCTSRAKYI